MPDDARLEIRVARTRSATGVLCRALLTLALGIGANTAIFSLVKGVLLNGLPYNDAEEIVVAWEQKPEGGTEFVSPPTFRPGAQPASILSRRYVWSERH